MRHLIKQIINRLSQLIALPFVLTCWLESLVSKKVEVIFVFWTNIFALLPGLPGVFLRRGFYSLTLEQCSLDSHIGFGSLFSHRNSVIEDNVYIGNYCSIGSAHIGENSLIGSRSSLLSGSGQHIHNDETGTWGAFSTDNIKQIQIGKNVWLGEAAIVMADIGEGCQIAAGTVISNDTKSYVMLAGNPARFVKSLPLPAQLQTSQSQIAPLPETVSELPNDKQS
jgi:acetyltransferase-like isoleucine patch superfamily enzyme